MQLGWGQENPIYRQMFTSIFMPEATAEDMDSFNELQRVSVAPENAFRTRVVTADIDLRNRLPVVTVPTPVLHSREELQAPFEWGRQVAALIPRLGVFLCRAKPISCKKTTRRGRPLYPKCGSFSA